MRFFYAVGYLTVLPINVLAKPLVENARLRRENTELEAEVHALAAIADDMARKAAKAMHPSALTAELADLDACDTVGDFLWLTGGDQ